MPTYDWTSRFQRDFESLTPDQQATFLRAVSKFVQNLKVGRFRRGSCVKAYRGGGDLFELTLAPDGRALFSYGAPVHLRDAHIVWHRVGTLAIFDNP
jgi:hypothetical protein